MTLEEISAAIIAFVRDNRAWAAPVVGLLAFGESLAFISLVLPFWAMLVTLGTVLQASGLDFTAILIAAAIGAALGDWVSYWIGHRYNTQIAKVWPLSRYPDLLPRGHAFFEKWGVWAIVLGRFSGPLRASVPLVAGIVEMPRLTFQIANWASAFLWAAVLLLFGDVITRAIGWTWKALGWS
ncbi:MAG: DedA family protein [Pseudomonadota bacterium]